MLQKSTAAEKTQFVCHVSDLGLVFNQLKGKLESLHQDKLELLHKNKLLKIECQRSKKLFPRILESNSCEENENLSPNTNAVKNGQISNEDISTVNMEMMIEQQKLQILEWEESYGKLKDNYENLSMRVAALECDNAILTSEIALARNMNHMRPVRIRPPKIATNLKSEASNVEDNNSGVFLSKEVLDSSELGKKLNKLVVAELMNSRQQTIKLLKKSSSTSSLYEKQKVPIALNKTDATSSKGLFSSLNPFRNSTATSLRPPKSSESLFKSASDIFRGRSTDRILPEKSDNFRRLRSHSQS
jgi:hypothetical protein